MRFRSYPQSNYRAVFFNGKTVRKKFDQNNSFQVTPFPEIEDVGINTKCLANCSYCYTSAIKEGLNFEDIVNKADEVWGSLSLDDRPFQIAIGGSGESTMHPDWVDFVRTVNGLGILPNYTTNGMHLSPAVLSATELYCGGVAISFHPHIELVFHRAVSKLKELETKLNVHLILGSDQSLLDLKRLYSQYQDVFDYFVILPYQAAGRGVEMESTHRVWQEAFGFIKEVRSDQFAFGALFYEWMKENTVDLDISMYEPEMFSGYRLMDNSYKVLRCSSYDLRPKELVL